LQLSHKKDDSNDVKWLEAQYTYTPQCSNNPQIKAVATDGTETDSLTTSAASGFTTFLSNPFKTLGATVTLLCNGVTVVERAINDPSSDPSATPTPVPPTATPLPWTGTLKLKHVRAETGEMPVIFLQVEYSFTPDCSNNPQAKAVADDDDATTATDDHVARSKGVTTFNGVFLTHGATVTLLCDGATVKEDTIAAPS
jgi:hypothetical protein